MDNMIFTSEVCGVVLIAPFDKISRPPCSTIRFIVFLSLFFRCFSPFSFYHRTVSLTKPMISYASGGGQEHHMRAGTENVASIVGMATALKKNVATMKDTASHLALLENRLLVGLSNANIRFTRNGIEVNIP